MSVPANNVPLIDVRNLEKRYESEGVVTTALRGLTLSIDHGEFVAIMGPSGSGKSTFLQIIGFLDQPTGGQYIFDGVATEQLPDEELAKIRNEKIGFVFQAFNLLGRTTVLENVILPLRYSNVPMKEREPRARVALEKVGLNHRLYHTSGQLSGGEKQRVAIARALVNNPKLILADEPTGNLDSKSGQAVMETIDQLHHEGHTIVVITHETPTAGFAQRIVDLRDGELVGDRKQETVIHDRAYTK